MRLKVIKKLVDINILYSSQEANLANLRKKQAKNPGKKVNVSARVLSSYIFSSLLMLFMFINIASVSYTHLDVYKRQHLGL